ncbi:MAG: DUF981 family protein, partial [Candidatus Marsarchaeota archaeon]|nr:DUF981 family protein [Candidatus Marsarchaeota archaeon]
MASFFDEIEKNRIRSMVLMSLFSLLFIAVIYLLIDVFFGGGIFGLTQAPIALLGLYFLYGLAGIFSYPVALIADRLPGLQKNAW